MKAVSLKQGFLCARTEYFKWITNPRMILLISVFVLVKQICIDPLIANAELMESKLNVFEPFVAVTNSTLLLLLMPILFITMASDFPEISESTILYVFRIGRKNWIIGQIIHLVFMSLTFLLFMLVLSTLPAISHIELAGDWSNVVTDFEKVFPDKAFSSPGVSLLPGNLFRQMHLMPTLIWSVVFVFAYFMIIGLVLLLFSLIKKKVIGFICAGGIIGLGSALGFIKSSFMWITPMAHSVTWLHYTAYFRQPVFPMWGSLIYFLVLIVILIVMCYILARKFNFDSITGNDA